MTNKRAEPLRVSIFGRETAAFPLLALSGLMAGVAIACLCYVFPFKMIAIYFGAAVLAALILYRIELGVLILTCELVLGGAGRWLVFPLGISVRQVLFLWLFVVWLIRQKKRPLGERRFGMLVLFLIVFLTVVFTFIGVFSSNNPLTILDDANGSLYYLSYFIIADILLQRKREKRWLAFYLSAVVILSLLSIAVFSVLTLGLETPHAINTMLKHYQLGVAGQMPASNIFRVYFKSGMFILTGLVLAWSIMLFTRSRRTRWILGISGLIMLFALIISQARGAWAGALLSLIILSFFIQSGKKFKLVVILLLCLLGVEVVGSQYQFSPMSFILERMGLMFNKEKGVSTIARRAQAEVLLEKIAERPLLGWGYGASVPKYKMLGDYASQSSFELGYLEMLFKTGLIGTLIWFMFLAAIFRAGIRLFKRSNEPADRAIILGFLGGLAGMILLGGTNPYVTASLGVGFIAFTMAYFEAVDARTEGGFSCELIDDNDGNILLKM